MGETTKAAQKQTQVTKETLLQAWELMCTAKRMSNLYNENLQVTSKYVHATSRGHEAAQLGLALQLKPQDFLSAYYRDDSMLLAIGMKPYDLMLQLFAKRDDPFSGGRTYYSHPSLNDPDKPKIPHQSSATGMQAIPTTGVAMGIQYKELQGIAEDHGDDKPIVVCSLGDASITEGEVAEAFQMAVLKKLPIMYFIQDNEWDISASADEIRAQDATGYAKGFAGLGVRTVENGHDFIECYKTIREVITTMRKERRPFLIHLKVPLLSHHTSGVRMEWYRDDLEDDQKRDPYPYFKNQLLDLGFKADELDEIEKKAITIVEEDFKRAQQAEDPRPEDLTDHMFAPTPITEEKGERNPAGKEKTVMVDSALFAMREILEKHPEALLYGQDVGHRLGGVFREAATLAQQFGKNRVFNTPIQEAFIIGSTVGMSAVGLKPIVEVQFADYIWPGLNQLFTEVSRSNYLSNGKWPVGCVIRVPIGAYGSGGPYHSSSIETVLSGIRGIKVAYPSTGADLKGLLKAAYYDPNPCVLLEHKGLYWSKIKGTEAAKTTEPDEDYVVPFGKARIVQEADQGRIDAGESLVIMTYGRGVYWSTEAAEHFPGQVEILDLRSITPVDAEAVFGATRKHSKVIVVTEEPRGSSFGQGIAGRIVDDCFESLDAPVLVIGSENTPAIPLNEVMEQTYLPNAEEVRAAIERTLSY
ncbi:MAG: tungsten formylmethanofuran dehydrogenase [Flavobacteriales bacterium]|jgi:2-oxoisovalerate dehydrogenase E1 component|nr:tungsten formylmethanofuran dehydrogenase [Flavobacteriales bacterium]NCG30239.1 tungsten formylmethanofuran dehydrogenase [Bacteroidota bacterium]MBT3963861.1 tungsten formylmethanofuran dehydrogenase [Flavobacteriales bacterium]MBT4706231.1 tungsten formylmethanofuran dehydrogenase [Flavobacteriales bacterium]MBT4929519.1 tungsten formylmethanofuran dehydrogenase [Flavobacteriales bacterium]